MDNKQNKTKQNNGQPAWSIGLHLAELTKKLVGEILPKMYTKIFIFWYLLFNTPLVELWCRGEFYDFWSEDKSSSNFEAYGYVTLAGHNFLSLFKKILTFPRAKKSNDQLQSDRVDRCWI